MMMDRDKKKHETKCYGCIAVFECLIGYFFLHRLLAGLPLRGFPSVAGESARRDLFRLFRVFHRFYLSFILDLTTFVFFLVCVYIYVCLGWLETTSTCATTSNEQKERNTSYKRDEHPKAKQVEDEEMPTANALSFRPLGGSVAGISNRLSFYNGCTIPQLGFGTYRMTSDKAVGAVTFALSCGYRHIDCAKAYGNEAAVGAALSQAMRSRRMCRDEIFVTSKLWPTDQHPDHVETACRASLEALRVEYLDLYLVHWPVCMRHTKVWNSEEDKYPCDAEGRPAIDTSVTLFDTWRAMSDLVRKGLVKSIGLANCTAAQIETLFKEADAAKLTHLPVLNQIELHPALVDGDLVACHGAHAMLTSAYCPLAMPTRFTPLEFQPLVEDETLKMLSSFTGYTPARLLLNWNLDRNNVVIVKSTNKDHIKSNAKAARFALEDRARAVLESYRFVSRNFRVMNPTHFTVDRSPFFAFEDARLQKQIDASNAREKPQ
jgi:alcohol dehydrogenase (NADP+)